MNRKLALTCLLSLITYVCAIAQKEIYLDENNKSVNRTNYLQKCKAQIFKCYTYSTDSIKVNKVLHKFGFGKITPTEASQLRLLLSQRTKSEIDSSATLVITYRDTLFGFEHRLARHEKHLRQVKEGSYEEPPMPEISGNVKVRPIRHNHKPYTRKKFNKTINAAVKKMNKCSKKTERKFNSRVFYTYKYDKGFLKDHPKHWVKDNGVIKSSFFKIMYESHLVILRPNGEYFLGGSHLSDEHFKKLLKTKNWSLFERDWKNSMQSNSKEGLGIFKRNYGLHQQHCF